jgi:hypothetical protein
MDILNWKVMAAPWWVSYPLASAASFFTLLGVVKFNQ